MTADDAEAAEVLKALFILADKIAAHDEQEKRRISAAHTDALTFVIAMTDREEAGVRSCIDACMERIRHYRDVGDVAAYGWELAVLDERAGDRRDELWAIIQMVLTNVGRYLPDTEATALH